MPLDTNTPLIKNTESLRCKLALCISSQNIYRIASDELTLMSKNIQPDLSSDTNRKQITRIFKASLQTLSATVLSPDKKIQLSTLQNMVIQSRTFRQEVKKKSIHHPLLSLPEMNLDDFVSPYNDPEDEEKSVFLLAVKLGFCVRKEPTFRDNGISLKGRFLLKNDKPVLNRLEALRAIDVEKNLIDKPGCGLHIDTDFAQKLYMKYQGVYALYFQSGVKESSDVDSPSSPAYVKAALRVSHTIEYKHSSVIRLKLNMENKNNHKARYQYRGYLQPIGKKDFLNLTLYLSSTSINREAVLPEASLLMPDVINIICSRMEDIDRCFTGILTSLNQRELGNRRLPYAVKVVAKKQIFPGDEDETFTQEKRFMKSSGLGIYSSLDELLKSITDSSEVDFVRSYFETTKNQPFKLLDTGWP